ncbi:MAG: hypothetical protein KDD50_07185 [Bdellovibrionales bacterium]|nr:hypothetical protein [Bdellovibrionales bacterium]
MDQQGIATSELYELTDLPMEFIRDPNSWLECHKTERFLDFVESLVESHFPDTDVISKVGRQSYKLRSWGVLDSVLRMMQKPQDIYLQPHRLLSYFVSPDPPVGEVRSTDSSVSFHFSIDENEYPLTIKYLKAVLESLPKYVGKDYSHVQWQNSTITIDWADEQQPLLQEADLGTAVSPDLLHSLMEALDDSQKQLQKKNEELLFKDEQLEKLNQSFKNLMVHSNVLLDGSEESLEIKKPIAEVRSEFMRLNDYLSRAQQLITLLVGQGRKDAQVRSAMKRVGWDDVVCRIPKTVQNGLDELDNLEGHI